MQTYLPAGHFLSSQFVQLRQLVSLSVMSTLQQPDLDFASVVHVTTRHPKWTLQDDEPLALLHSNTLNSRRQCAIG